MVPRASKTDFSLAAPLLCAALLAVTCAASGCATMGSAGADTQTDDAVDAASSAVEAAADDAKFELIAAYERRGMQRAANDLRAALRDHPEFEARITRSRARALTVSPRTIGTYRRILQFRAEHPDIISTQEYVDFLADFIEATDPSVERYDAMKRLRELRPDHEVPSDYELRRERIAAANRYLLSEQPGLARPIVEKLQAGLDAADSSVPGEHADTIRLMKAKLAAASDRPEVLRESLTAYVLASDSRRFAVDQALTLLSKHNQEDLGVDWLGRLIKRLEDDGENVAQLYYARAEFGASNAGDPERVRDDLRRALQDVGEVNEFRTAYEMLERLGSPALGDEFLKKVQSADPSMSDRRWLFRAYARRGMRGEALGVADRFVETWDTAGAYSQAASWMKRAGWPAAARDWMEEAVRRDRDNWVYAVELYRLSKSTGHTKYARFASERLVDLAGDNYGRVSSLASEFKRHGELRRAAELLWKNFAAGHRALSNASRIASIEIQLGRTERALDAFDKSLNRPYVSARHWQMAASQIEARIGLKQALPYYREAADRGASTNVAALLNALQRSGRYAEMHRRILSFLAEEGSSATSIEVLCARLSLDDLPENTRFEILSAYAESGGNRPRLSSRVLTMFAERDQWDRALSFLRDNGIPQTLAEIVILRGHGRHRPPRQREAIPDELLGGLVAALERSTEPPEEMSKSALEFSARLHTQYVRVTAKRPDVGTRAGVIESRSSAHRYFRELVRRSTRDAVFEPDLLSELVRADLPRLAEEYLVDMRDVVEPRSFWKHYTEVLDAQGRIEAAQHTARRHYELLEPHERVPFALSRVSTGAASERPRAAEPFLRRAIALADHDATPAHLERQINLFSYGQLGHLLMQDGRASEYIELTKKLADRAAGTGFLHRHPDQLSALDILLVYGHESAYAELVTKLLESDEDNLQWNLHLALTHVRQGHPERSVRFYERFNHHRPSLEKYARALAAMNQPRRALEVLSEVENAGEQRPLTHLVLEFIILTQMDRTDEAAGAIIELIEGRSRHEAAAIDPYYWNQLRRAVERAGAYEPIAASLREIGSDSAIEAAEKLRSRRNEFVLATNVADLELAPLSASDTDPPDPWAAINSGLEWMAAERIVESIKMGASAPGMRPIWRVRDDVVRLGLLPDLVDTKRGSTGLSPIGTVEAAGFLLMAGRNDQLQAIVDASRPGGGAWAAAMMLGDVERAIELHAPRSIWSQRTNAFIRVSDLHSMARLSGHRLDARSMWPPGIDTPEARRLEMAFEFARRLDDGRVAQVLSDARRTLQRLGEDEGVWQASQNVDALMTQLGAASVMGYRSEAQAILGRAESTRIPIEAEYTITVLEDDAEVSTNWAELPDDMFFRYTGELTRQGRMDAARRLLSERDALGDASASEPWFELALALDDRDAVRSHLNIARERVAVGGQNTQLTLRNALRAGDFDTAAELGLLSGIHDRRPNPHRVRRLLSSLGRPELLSRFDRQPRSTGSLSSNTPMAGELWPPLASLDYHRQRLDETLEAYPRDMVATLSRLLLELVNAPSERGRPQLRRYVDAHADDPTRMRDLVYALDSHELEVEIATTVLPRVEPDDLPATTNRTLFASAVHANRPEQANALADLLLERLPDTAYVASDLAREALDHGHDELASRLLARAKAAGSIPYTRLVEARIELGAHASAAGVDIANELLDRHELAPSDHCPLFVDALDAGETVLARRLVRSMVMLPTRNRGRVASWMIRRTSDCLIGAGKAAPGLRLLVAEFPRIADGARSSLDPYMAIEMARLYREAGRPDVASDLLESANTSLKLFQQRRAPARLWRERAKTAIALGALDDALRFARTSMHTGSPTEIAEGLAVLAEVHAARGDYATATAYLRVAYARHPKLERRNQIRLRLLTVRRAGDDHFLSENDASVTLTTKRP